MKKEFLEPDCSNCAALCCVVFAFDKSESFAIDKAAGEVCPNLENCGRCGVFGDRATLGFKGCITYDCYGAGQRVTQEVFNGRSWRQDPRLTEPMGAALSVLRRIHEQISLIRTACALPLDADERSNAKHLEHVLTPVTGWTEASLQMFPIDEVTKDVAHFLRSLRRHITRASERT